MKPLDPLAPIRPIEPMRPLEPLRLMEPMRPMEPMELMTPMEPMRLEINPMQYSQYKGRCRLQLHVSRHLNPFHPAYTCTRSGAAKSTPTVNGTGGLPTLIRNLHYVYIYIHIQLLQYNHIQTQIHTADSSKHINIPPDRKPCS